MTANRLPKYIDPMKLVERSSHISGELAIASLTSLKEFLIDNEGNLQLDLHFDRDAEGVFRIYGSIKGALRLECQRCLKPMTYPLDIAVSLSPVASIDAAKKLPSQYEPLLLEEDPMLLSSLVEEEVLINLPMIPKHESEQCQSA